MDVLLLGEKGTSKIQRLISVRVKVFGCRPHDGVAARAGPASANLQGKKPRVIWRGVGSDAMGILPLAVCC